MFILLYSQDFWFFYVKVDRPFTQVCVCVRGGGGEEGAAYQSSQNKSLTATTNISYHIMIKLDMKTDRSLKGLNPCPPTLQKVHLAKARRL